MPKFSLLLALLFIMINGVIGQRSPKENYLLQLKQKKIDTAYVSACTNLIDVYEGNNNDSALLFSRKALTVLRAYAKTHGRNRFYVKQIALVNLHTGMVYKSIGDYKLAINYLFEASKHAYNSHLEKEQADIYNNIGIVYRNAGNNNKAIEMYNKSLEISKRINDSILIGESFINLAVVYRSAKEYNKSIYYNNKGLRFFDRKNNLDYVGQIYNNLGVVYKHKENFDSALICYEKSLAIHESLGNIEQIALTYNNLGNIYRIKKEYDKAEIALKSGNELSIKCGSIKKQCDALIRLGIVYFETNQIKNAKQFLIEAVTLAEPKQLHDALKEAYSYLKKIEELNQNYKQALVYSEKEKAYMDSIAEKEKKDEFERNKVLLELKLKNYTDSVSLKEGSEINALKKKVNTSNKRTAGVFFYSFLLIFVLVFLLVYLKRKSK